jgi:hypothetical protein
MVTETERKIDAALSALMHACGFKSDSLRFRLGMRDAPRDGDSIQVGGVIPPARPPAAGNEGQLAHRAVASSCPNQHEFEAANFRPQSATSRKRTRHSRRTNPRVHPYHFRHRGPLSRC